MTPAQWDQIERARKAEYRVAYRLALACRAWGNHIPEQQLQEMVAEFTAAQQETDRLWNTYLGQPA